MRLQRCPTVQVLRVWSSLSAYLLLFPAFVHSWIVVVQVSLRRRFPDIVIQVCRYPFTCSLSADMLQDFSELFYQAPGASQCGTP